MIEIGNFISSLQSISQDKFLEIAGAGRRVAITGTGSLISKTEPTVEERYDSLFC